MWPFKESRRVSKLEDRMEIAERELQAIALEWENVFRKLRKIMGKIHKEESIMRESTATEGEELASTPATVGTSNGGRLLTPRQMQIQQEILKRRAHG
jgi:hypothetical protein